MLTLIKREIEDHIAYFAGAAVISAILVLRLIYIGYNFDNDNLSLVDTFFPTGFFYAILIVLGLCIMGKSQMSVDRNKKISAFLSTLPVSRRRILAARIIAGLLTILIALVPPAITAQFLLNTFKPPYPVYPYFTIEILSSLFLTTFAIYCIGLMSGFSTSKMAVGIGIILSFVFFTLIFIKGCSLQSSVIPLLFIAASLTYTWKKFMKIPLI
jgi:ABC-type transport system involved in multi-copper enzyme maturation permease subunit